MILSNFSSKISCCCSRSKLHSKTVYYSFRPLFNFSRCFGLFPFSIKTNLFGEVQRVKLTFFDLAWFCIAIAMYLTIAVFILFDSNNAQADVRTTYILVTGDKLLLVFGLLMCAASIIMDMINRNRILWNIQRFEVFDKEVNCGMGISFLIYSTLSR